MVEFVPIFETQYTMPLIISIAIVTDTVTSRLNENHTSKSFFISLLILVAVTFIQGGLFLSLK